MEKNNHVENKTFPGWKKGLVISLALSITAMLFVFFTHFEEETLACVFQLRPGFLFWGFMLFFSLWIVEGLRIKLLMAVLENGKSISLADAIQVFLVTFFFAAVTPFAAGEWPANIVILHRKGLSLGEASAVTIARAFLTKMVFTLTSLLILLGYSGKHPLPIFVNRIFITAIFISFILGLLFFILLWRPGLLEWLMQQLDSIPWVTAFLKKSIKAKRRVIFLKNEIKKFSVTARCFKRGKAGTIIVILILTMFFWLCFFSIGPVLLMGLNTPVPYFNSLAWQFVVQIILPYVPIPGGSGVVELSLASLFKYFVPSSVLGLFVIAWRFFTYYLLLFFGGLASLGNLKT